MLFGPELGRLRFRLGFEISHGSENVETPSPDTSVETAGMSARATCPRQNVETRSQNQKEGPAAAVIPLAAFRAVPARRVLPWALAARRRIR